jgi:hypothetical protein
MTTPLADQPLVWLCRCGKRPWAHALHCACGAERPRPPESTPDDGSSAAEPQPDVAWP